jgi:FixJ family two-component response regulator
MLNSQNVSHVIYLIDDDDDCRRSIQQFLKFKGYQVFSYRQPEDFLAESLIMPSVIILDMCMPSISGVDVQATLIKRQISLPMIFVSGQSTFQEAIAAMKHGAFAFLEKPFSPEELLTAVRQSFEALETETANAMKLLKKEAMLELLSPRERMVFDLLCEGFSNPQLVEHLAISMATVKEYKANVFRKLEVDHLSELMKLKQI